MCDVYSMKEWWVEWKDVAAPIGSAAVVGIAARYKETWAIIRWIFVSLFMLLTWPARKPKIGEKADTICRAIVNDHAKWQFTGKGTIFRNDGGVGQGLFINPDKRTLTKSDVEISNHFSRGERKAIFGNARKVIKERMEVARKQAIATI